MLLTIKHLLDQLVDVDSGDGILLL